MNEIYPALIIGLSGIISAIAGALITRGAGRSNPDQRDPSENSRAGYRIRPWAVIIGFFVVATGVGLSMWWIMSPEMTKPTANPGFWASGWLQTEERSGGRESVGSMELLPICCSNCDSIQGYSYNEEFEKSRLIASISQDGKSLSGRWNNLEKGTDGTFEFHKVSDQSFEGTYTFGTETRSWSGKKLTTPAFKTQGPNGFVNFRKEGLSQSEMKIVTGEDDGALFWKTIIGRLPNGTPAWALQRLKPDASKASIPIIARYNGDLRLGYLAKAISDKPTLQNR